MARSKVAHIITKLELGGGAQKNTLFTVNHLDPQRFNPVLISGRGGMLDAEAMGSGVPMHFSLSLHREISLIGDFNALREIISFLREERPLIVHTHSSKAGVLGRVAAWWTKIPFVVHTFHGFAFHNRQNPFKRWLFIKLERLMAGLTHRLIFVSKSNWETALRLKIGKEKQYVLIRSGVAISEVRETPALSPEERKGVGVPEGHPLVVSIGNLKPQKNPIAFVDLAEQVLEQIPEARFLFIGDGVLRPKVERELARRRIESKVFFPGWIRRPLAWIRAADVFAMTSLWEGLPRSLVEAMILGKACACFAADGVIDILKPGDTGALVALGETSALAEEIVRILRDPERKKRLGEAARLAIGEDFDIHQMVRQQEKLYEELLHTTPAV